MSDDSQRTSFAGTTGIAHIKASHNNTLVSITKETGDALCWASAGSCGYKGARRATTIAGHAAAQRAGERAFELGLRTLRLRISGDGPGLAGALDGLRASGLELSNV
jgi:small subunit ribosomal protein S11